MADAPRTIREYRELHGSDGRKISQRELAEMLSTALGREIPRQYVTRWESDPAAVPADVRAALGLQTDPLEPIEGDGAAEAGEREQAAAAEGRPDESPPAQPDSVTVVVPVGGDLKERIQKFYEGAAAVLLWVEPHDAQVLASIAEQAAAAWAAVAKTNPGVARMWNFLTMPTGPWGMVVFAHVPATIAILAHHNLIPQMSLFPQQVRPDAASHGQADGAGGVRPVDDSAAAAA